MAWFSTNLIMEVERVWWWSLSMWMMASGIPSMWRGMTSTRSWPWITSTPTWPSLLAIAECWTCWTMMSTLELTSPLTTMGTRRSGGDLMVAWRTFSCSASFFPSKARMLWSNPRSSNRWSSTARTHCLHPWDQVSDPSPEIIVWFHIVDLSALFVVYFPLQTYAA